MKESLSTATTENQPTANPMYSEFSNDIHLVEFYQAIPKFYDGDQSKIRIKGLFLHSLEREFSFDGNLFQALIAPGRIQENGNVIACFAGDAERQVEQVIWRLAYDYRKQHPSALSGVFEFSVTSIQAKLIRRGYNFPTAEITKSLKILSEINIEVQFGSGNLKGAFEIISPIRFLKIKHAKMTKYRMNLNPYFMTSLNQGKFRLDM